MKIAICADEEKEQGLTGECVSRSPYLVLADSESGEITTLPNPAVDAQQHRGQVAAEAIIDAAAEAVIGTHFGHKAHALLTKWGVSVYQVAPGRVSDVIADYRSGRLRPVKDGTPCAHQHERARECRGGRCCH